MEQESKKIIYAGFFTRLLAALVDILIISLILIPILGIVGLVNDKLGIGSIVVLAIVWWLYNTIMLMKWGSTLGGKLFGIEVLNHELESLSFKSASFRFILSITPVAIYIMLKIMLNDMEFRSSPTVQQLPQLIILLAPLLMFFTQKKQMIHDLLANSTVVDRSQIQYIANKEENRNRYVVQKILRIIGSLIVISVTVPIVAMTTVFFFLDKQSHDSYNNSFKQYYTTNDYNDSKIIFYNQELEKNTQKFIEAKGMYEVFEADVKKDLALNCIKYLLEQEHNASDWIEMGSGFRKNARNKYANTDAMIKKAKKNERHMGKHFYYYDLNAVNHIVDDIFDKRKRKSNTETCQKMLPVDQMYTMFVTKYIKNREEALEANNRKYQHAKPYGTLNKSFYKTKIEKTFTWLEMLYEKHPRALKEKKELEVWSVNTISYTKVHYLPLMG